MSDFFGPAIDRVARTKKRCMYCGQRIDLGEQYTHQKGMYDGRWQETKMHPECFNDMVDEGDGEYSLYSGERPELETTE